MQMYQFLSDDWIEAVQQLEVGHEDNPVAVEGLVVNATITGVPFGDGTIQLHSERGPMVGWRPGHAASATLAFVIDYRMAHQLILDESPDFELLVQEIESGALVIEGDTEVLRTWFSTRFDNPEAVALENAVRAITL